MSGFLCTMVGASFTVAAAAEVIRKKQSVIAIANAQIDTAQSYFGGSSAYFDGVQDRLHIATNDGIFFTGDFTIEMWMRSGNETGMIFGNVATNVSPAAGQVICYYSPSPQRLEIYFNGQTALTTNTTIAINTWYHIAMVRSGSTVKVYVNGTEQSSTKTVTGDIGTSTYPTWYIGGLTNDADCMLGHLDEIRFSKSARYTTGFTPSTTPFVNDDNTVLLIHADGTDGSTFFEDDNGVRAPIRLTGLNSAALSTAQSRFGGSSLIGNNTTNQQVEIDPRAITVLTGPFTIECFFRTTNLTQVNKLLIFTSESQAGRRGLHITNQTFRYSISGTDVITTGNFLTSGTWHHLALVRDSGNTTNLYVDGTSRGSYANDTLGFSGSGSSRIFGLAGGFTPEGHIDEFRISKVARYTSTFTPPTEPFVNDADTTLLVHFDGTDASTVFRDDNGLVPATYTSDVVAFDGTGDYYDATSLSSSVTADSKYALIALNLYWAGGNNLQHPFNIRLGTGSGDNGFWVWINGGRSQLKFVTGTGSVPGSIYENTENSLTANAWNQIVIWVDTTSSTTSQIWVNGNSKAYSNDGFPTGSLFNWTNTASTVKIGQKNTSQTGDGNDFNGRISQVYLSAASTFPGIEYFWDKSTNRPKDFGTDGRATGLAQPLIYHYGGTSTFPTNRGNFASYTLTANGNVATNAANTIYARARRQRGIQALGNAQIDTAQSKFGGSSALFDGTGDYLRVYDLPAISTGDFTVEFWFRPNYSSSPNMLLWDNRGSVSTSTGAQLINFIGASPVINYWVAGSYRITGTTVLSSGTWYHIAVSRSGTSTKLFINGTQDGSTYTDSNSYVSNPGQYIGQAYDGGASANGHIDEFRVSNSARYTANFTAPTAPFQNDANTVLLLHMDGTDASTVFFDDNGRDTTPST